MMSNRNFGVRKCVWCGKEFVAKAPKQNSCGEDHYRPCAMCGEPLLVKESFANYMKYGPRTCEACRRKKISLSHRSMPVEKRQEILSKMQATTRARYGVDNAMQCKEIYEKAKATVQLKYGVDNLSQSSDIQTRIRNNSLAKYGVEHYSQDPKIRANMIDGMIKKYGVDNPQKSSELQNKTKKTCLEKYGVENVLSSKAIQEKVKQTCLAKYGVEHAASAPEVVAKRTQTNLDRYNGPSYIFGEEYLKSLMTDPSKYDECKKFREDPIEYIKSHYDHLPTYKELSIDLGICDSSIIAHLNKFNAKNYIKYTLSTLEDEVCQYIRSLDSTIEIIRHDRKLISPKEIDIYLPEYHLGIECDPVWTHNSSFPDPWSGEIRPVEYHKIKTNLCESIGIKLIHIFGHEWKYQSSIIKSMIASFIHRSPAISADDTTVVKLDSEVCSKFLNANHLHGDVESFIKLGLQTNSSNLVSVMTFSKILDTNTSRFHIELSRFCDVSGVHVIGSAEKLFEYAKTEYQFSEIFTKEDRAHLSLFPYESLGFKPMMQLDPEYTWVSINDSSYYDDAGLAVKIGSSISDFSLEYAESLGYARVYDSGYTCWVWTQFRG